jgi:hypothetical protein
MPKSVKGGATYKALDNFLVPIFVQFQAKTLLNSCIYTLSKIHHSGLKAAESALGVNNMSIF